MPRPWLEFAGMLVRPFIEELPGWLPVPQGEVNCHNDKQQVNSMFGLKGPLGIGLTTVQKGRER